MRVNPPYAQPDCARSPSTPALSPTSDRGILVFSRLIKLCCAPANGWKT